MKVTRRNVILSTLSAGSLLMLGPKAFGQQMPEGTLTIVVPFPAGSKVTTIARLVAPVLERELGRTVIVENHPGAGTVIATNHVLQAPHDGQMILMMSNSFFINKSLRPNLNYDPLADFAPVSLLATLSHMLVAPPDYEGDFDTFLEEARNAGDRPLRFGAGTGTSNHLLAEEFCRKAGIEAVHIPYTGAAPTYTDIMGGRLDFTFASMGDAVPNVEAGKMKGLAIAGASRHDTLPDIPTLAEKGIDVTMTDALYGAVIPADTPTEVIEKWRAAFRTALENPKNRETIANWSLDPGSVDAGTFGEIITQYEETASGIVNELGLEIEA